MEFHGVKQSNKVILMKVTSRERPKILLDTVSEYIRLANNTADMVWLFSFDRDDKICNNHGFINSIELLIPTSSRFVIGRSSSKISAINNGLNLEDRYWDILLNISDDQRPILQGYDDIIRRAMPDDLDASLWFTDGQPRINTQEIIGKKYYERFGYIYHPDFKSLFCDNLSTDMALFLGKCIKSNKQIVKHFHPAWGGSEAFKMDSLYERNNQFWNEDEATYKRIVSAGLDKLIL